MLGVFSENELPRNIMANQNSQASAGGLFRSAKYPLHGNLASRILGLLREAVIALFWHRGRRQCLCNCLAGANADLRFSDWRHAQCGTRPRPQRTGSKKQEAEYTKLLGILFTLFGAVLLLLVCCWSGALLSDHVLAVGFRNLTQPCCPLPPC